MCEVAELLAGHLGPNDDVGRDLLLAAAGAASSVRPYLDQLEFLGQLGLLPEPAAAAAG